MVPAATPPGDPDRPSSARVYSYLQGGNDWYPADRALALKLESIYPGVRDLATSNRTYIQHATLYAVSRLRIRQFLDLGSGFPSAGSVLDHAQQAEEGCVVAAVDWDPAVAGEDGYGPLLEEQGVKGFASVLADISDPDAVLEHPDVTGLIDFGWPVCAVFGAVLHNFTWQEARRVTAAYAKALAPGSAMVITVGRDDAADAPGELPQEWRTDTGGWMSNFSVGQVGALFGEFEILPPGVAPAGGCRPGWTSGRKQAGPLYVVGGIGVKPLPRRRSTRHV